MRVASRYGNRPADCCIAPFHLSTIGRHSRNHQSVYIIAIAWLYVVILMAVFQPTFFAALGTLIGYGILPLALFVWIVGTPQRRRTRAAKNARNSMPMGEQPDTPDHQHPKRDQ